MVVDRLSKYAHFVGLTNLYLPLHIPYIYGDSNVAAGDAQLLETEIVLARFQAPTIM